MSVMVKELFPGSGREELGCGITTKTGLRLKSYHDGSDVDAKAKQKAASVAFWEQKLTAFEDRLKFSEKIFLAPQRIHRLNASVCGITSPSITSA